MSDREPLSIQKLPAARGLAWLSGSWQLVKRQPLRLLLISLFFQFFLSFSQVEAIGLLVVLCLPILSAGMLHAFFLVEQNEKPMLAVLFMPLVARAGVGRLLLLGGIVIVLGLLVISLTLAGQMVDLDPEILKRIEQGDLDAIQFVDPQILESAILVMAVGAAISGCITYFSVPLIWFRHLGVGNALVTGLKAMARNWKPLLVIGLLLGVLAVPIVLLFGSFYLSALSEGASSSVLAFLLLLLGPLFQLLLFGTQYLAFRDIFGLDEAAAGQSKKKADQLVA
ncbi:MAG: hypothetical protein GY732_04955 [Gammaproteobacteria bacterium]|nr:hypothetical protein [Gammaproteobacteria bacterium]